MKESAFATSIKQTLRLQGYRAIKMHGGSMGEAGLPDLYVLAAPRWRGWLELKMGRNKPTPIQMRQIGSLRLCGESVYVLRYLDRGLLRIEDPRGRRIREVAPKNLIEGLRTITRYEPQTPTGRAKAASTKRSKVR